MSIGNNIARIAVDSNGYIQPRSLSSVDGSVFSDKALVTNFPSGSSVQMVSTLYQWYNSVALSTSWVDVPNMALTITPRTASSKLKIDIRWFGETQTAWDAVFGITRNGTLINMPANVSGRDPAIAVPVQTYIADDNNSTPELCFMSTIDYPGTTSAVTYKLVCKCNTTGRTLMTGRVFDSVTQGSNYEQGSCEIIITEYLA